MVGRLGLEKVSYNIHAAH